MRSSSATGGNLLLRSSFSKGFTLIELLVVIGIIGLLASTVLVSLGGARVQARNVRRKTDLTQLRLALELYYNSNTSYPTTGGVWFSSNPDDNPVTNYNGGNYIPGLAPAFMSVLPRDPGGPGTGCADWKPAYLYNSNGSTYTLLSHCAPEGAMSPTDSFYDPIRPTWAWKVCSGQVGCI